MERTSTGNGTGRSGKHVKMGRPATGRKTNAEYQAARRSKMAKFGICELRGMRISKTELKMLDELTERLGYSDRCELIMCEMRKLADQNEISYLAEKEQGA